MMILETLSNENGNKKKSCKEKKRVTKNKNKYKTKDKYLTKASIYIFTKLNINIIIEEYIS